MSKSTPQKDALLSLLQKQFKQVEREKKFDWLTTPPKSGDSADYPEDYRGIIDVLCKYRNRTEFCNVRPNDGKLSCDYVIEERKLIIEVDERQHFTEARRRALEQYPKDVKLAFSVSKWIEECARIQANDNDPLYRDEQRALYDSVRDIAAFRNGYTLVRIAQSDLDWLLHVM